MIALYAAFLYYQLFPPKRNDARPAAAAAASACNGDCGDHSGSESDSGGDAGNENDGDDGDDDDEEEVLLTLPAACAGLGVVSVLTAVASDALVDTIEGAAVAWGAPVAFVATVLLPIIGNASEHASAVVFAGKDRLDLSVGIALGSSAQISAFLVPACALAAAAFREPLTLDLGAFETASLAAAALLLVLTTGDGRSNALRGLVLVCAYLAFASACWAHADPRLDAERGGGAGDGDGDMLGPPAGGDTPPMPPPKRRF